MRRLSSWVHSRGNRPAGKGTLAVGAVAGAGATLATGAVAGAGAVA